MPLLADGVFVRVGVGVCSRRGGRFGSGRLSRRGGRFGTGRLRRRGGRPGTGRRRQANDQRQVGFAGYGRSCIVLCDLFCHDVGIRPAGRREGITRLRRRHRPGPAGGNCNRVVPGPIRSCRLGRAIDVTQSCTGNPSIARDGVGSWCVTYVEVRPKQFLSGVTIVNWAGRLDWSSNQQQPCRFLRDVVVQKYRTQW